MKLNISKYIASGLAVIALLPACSEDNYKLYDTTQKDSVFFEFRNAKNEIVDEIDYAFNYDIADVHTIEIPVTLMGMPKDYERTIKIEAIEEGTTMKPDVNYTITNNVIAPNEVKGVVNINLLRNNDPDILSESKQLVLTISENEDLKSVGENKITITYSDIRPTARPSWWTTWGPKPVYSYENIQLFFDYFYRLVPEASPEIFKEMIDAYGDYFVKASNIQGPFTMYEGFLRQYVMIPMYHEHPELEWYDSPLW